MASTTTSAPRSARSGLRATPEQERVLHRAAEVAHRCLTDFMDSACLPGSGTTLLDQRLFLVSGGEYPALLDRCFKTLPPVPRTRPKLMGSPVPGN